MKTFPSSVRRAIALVLARVAMVAGGAVLLAGCSHASFNGSVAGPWEARPGGPSRFPLASGETRDVVAALHPDEELWIIARPPAVAPTDGADGPGCGALVCRPPGAAADAPVDVPLPLTHTDVDASIEGYIASVNVRQQFENPYDGKIEAVYVFPLPYNAAVSDFVMTVGERRIRGIVRERAEAEALYADARRQGYVASLLTQERPNVFTQRVANIEPGHRIDVDITYFNTLAYADGWFEFVFPMVVGPRYNPSGSADPVVAAPRGAATGGTAITYLAPHERSGHDIDVDLTIDAGVAVEEIVCRTHVLEEREPGSSRRHLALAVTDRIPNRDLVVRFRVAGDVPKGSLLTHRDERGGAFTLMVYPPADLRGIDRSPLEMIFVVDCSGSMRGEPLSLARRAVTRAIRHLRPGDTVQVIRFSERAERSSRRPVVADERNVRAAIGFVRGLEAGGGTRLNDAVLAALPDDRDDERVRYVVFVTDGFIGNEAEVLGSIHRSLGEARVFSVGIGSAPNRFLLERMASTGRGAVAYLGPGDAPADVIDLCLRRMAHPVMTDVEIDYGGLAVRDVAPARPADLLVGRPIIVAGRFDGAPTGPITVRGRAAGRSVTIEVPVDGLDAAASRPALPLVWARRRIAEITTSPDHLAHAAGAAEIRGLALEYGIMSDYTAFIAVDASRRSEGGHGTTVPVAVPVPDGVRYDTTVRTGTPDRH